MLCSFGQNGMRKECNENLQTKYMEKESIYENMVNENE